MCYEKKNPGNTGSTEENKNNSQEKKANGECQIMKDFLQDIDEIRLRIPPAFQSQHRNERKECKPKMINRLTIRGQKV